MRVVFYDTKQCDRVYFGWAVGRAGLDLVFHEFRLGVANAASVEGAAVVCVFVNEKLNWECLGLLAARGVGTVVLRYAGFNNVDLDPARELGISVVRVPAYSPHSMAEHAVALLLTLDRRIHRSHNRVCELNFSLSGSVVFDLYGMTIGMAGTGRISGAAAQIFDGFGCEVLASDPFPEIEWAARHEIRYVGMNELLSESDVVSLYLPLTPESFHLLNRDTISTMKSGAYLINTSRGKLVDSVAVISALKPGYLGGVALDVYEEEEGLFVEDLSDMPLQDDMLSFPNVLVTSHQAFLTEEVLDAIAETTVDSIIRFIDGREAVGGRLLK
jgi:D-lactate dehydrogenase